MPGHKQEGGSYTHECLVDEIVQQMETDGAFNPVELLQKGGEKVNNWRKRAYAQYHGKERRTRELEEEGLDAEEIIEKLRDERYTTYGERHGAMRNLREAKREREAMRAEASNADTDSAHTAA
jgi:hypothetical protein